MRTLFLVFSVLLLASTGASLAQADWGHGGPGWGHGPGHGPGWGPGPGRPLPPPPPPGWGRPVPPPPPMFETQFVNCESNGYNINYCAVPGFIMGAQVSNQRSFAACELGNSYGYQGNQLWVKDGCRATFVVQIRR